MMNKLGIYVHVPFCRAKCPYCDFYSLTGQTEETLQAYTNALCAQIAAFAQTAQESRPVQSVYFGGGTPSLLGAKRLCAVLTCIRQRFPVENDAEITVEVNPYRAEAGDCFFGTLFAHGVNRISLGLQSANDEELRMLGRQHRYADTVAAVQMARAVGFTNLTVDLMAALPDRAFGDKVPFAGTWQERLSRSIAACAQLGADHVSCYLLKIEDGTFFGRKRTELFLPEEDDAAAQYLFLCEQLEQYGYRQYEISNFAHPGKESRHNLLYWHDEEYIGFGPAAHSFYRGKRFYYPRDLQAFLRGDAPIADGDGGDFTEYAMLSLRLAEGILSENVSARFGKDGLCKLQALLQKAKPYEKAGLLLCEHGGVRFTRQGFLVSNALLTEILE